MNLQHGTTSHIKNTINLKIIIKPISLCIHIFICIYIKVRWDKLRGTPLPREPSPLCLSQQLLEDVPISPCSCLKCIEVCGSCKRKWINKCILYRAYPCIHLWHRVVWRQSPVTFVSHCPLRRSNTLASKIIKSLKKMRQKEIIDKIQQKA